MKMMIYKKNEDKLIIKLLKYGKKIGLRSDELVSLIDVIGEAHSLEYNIETLFEKASLQFPAEEDIVMDKNDCSNHEKQ
jgi:hypothetical protein